MDNKILWDKFLENIKSDVSSLSYETWFKDTSLHKLDGNTAHVIVPFILHKKHLVENYLDIMESVMTSLTNVKYSFNFLLEDEIEEEVVQVEEKVYQDPIDSNLNPNYTFDSFIVGSSNKFAYTASQAVAENPGNSYNPLFLYGKSGLGKTHLMHSIGNHIIKNSDKKVLYISSDKFVNDFINAVRYNDKNSFDKIDSFKNKYRNIDVLIIDDIQFLGNAAKGQEEFFHTFNELYNLKKQIIIASDRSVDDLKSLENRLLTRFNWGLTANITPPDFDLRMNIIRKKILGHESADDVPEEVIEYIANNFDSDVRQLEGAITRVFAYSLMMNHGKVTLDVAIDALKDQMTQKTVFKNDVARVQRVVCDYYKISIDDMLGKKRTYAINFPRQVAIYLCRTLTSESFPKLGTYFGGRDHSTIISACQRIEKELKSNEQLKGVIKEIKKILTT